MNAKQRIDSAGKCSSQSVHEIWMTVFATVLADVNYIYNNYKLFYEEAIGNL